MEVTEFARETEVIPDRLNASFPIEVTPFGTVTDPTQLLFPVTTFDETVK